MTHSDRSAAGLARQCKGLRQRWFERLLKLFLIVGIVPFQVFDALLHLCLEGRRTRHKVRVGELLHLRLERTDRRNGRLDALNVALMLRADETRDYAVDYLFNIHLVSLPLCVARLTDSYGFSHERISPETSAHCISGHLDARYVIVAA